jgi:hypothetical protein
MNSGIGPQESGVTDSRLIIPKGEARKDPDNRTIWMIRLMGLYLLGGLIVCVLVAGPFGMIILSPLLMYIAYLERKANQRVRQSIAPVAITKDSVILQVQGLSGIGWSGQIHSLPGYEIRSVEILRETTGGSHIPTTAAGPATGFILHLKDGQVISITGREAEDVLTATRKMATGFGVEVMDPACFQKVEEANIYRRIGNNITTRIAGQVLLGFGLAFFLVLVGIAVYNKESYLNMRAITVPMFTFFVLLFALQAIAQWHSATWLRAVTITSDGFVLHHSKGDLRKEWNDLKWLSVKEGDQTVRSMTGDSRMKIRGALTETIITNEIAVNLRRAYRAKLGEDPRRG